MRLRRRKRAEDRPDAGITDPFGGGDVRIVPIDERSDADTDDADDPDATTEIEEDRDDALLVELSQAFDEPGEADPDDAGSAGGPATGSVSSKPATTPVPGDAASSALQTIAIGGDDDLPDAVYLDDELGLDGDGGTVFIDDDGRDDAIQPHDATGPGIEPRLRQRRIGVRRAEGRRRLRWVIASAAVLVVLVGILAVLGSGLFAIDEVDVTGARYTDPDELAAVVDDLRGTPVLLADTDAAERRLAAIPWVADARVRTDFPSGATIEIRERVPLAVAVGPDDRYRILDREGRVLQIEDGRPIAPVFIDSPLAVDLAPGEYADVGYAAAASLVTKLTDSVRTQLDSIVVTADGADMRLYLRDLRAVAPGARIEVRLGAAISENDQIEKLVRLERVLDDLETTSATIVDVSTEETTLR